MFAGILGATWLANRYTRAHLNPQLAWTDIAGISVLGAIGLTVSLLVADLSYTSTAHLTDAEAAILLASASLLAAAILGRRGRRYRRLGQHNTRGQTTPHNQD